MDIHQFRDFVNTFNTDFVRRHYSNVREKNYWACICSAMDWLTEAGEAMPEFQKRAKENDAGWIDLYGYISCIDVIKGATEQLHRCVFERGGNPSDLTFSNETIFTKPAEFYDLSDQEYFKELRAGFGAHPVNLKTRDKKIRRFASWVLSPERGQITNDFDFAVMLYSNVRGVEDIQLGVRLSELEKFCKQHQKHLENLVTEIKRQYSLFKVECRKRPIELSDDPAAQWKILTQEANNRAPGMCDPEIVSIFSINPIQAKNRRLLLSYQKTVCGLMQRMIVVFQKMNDRSIRSLYENAHVVMYPPYPQIKGLSYCIAKLFENTLPYSVLKSEIENFFGEMIDFPSIQSDEERRVLVQAALYRLSQKRILKPRPSAATKTSMHSQPPKRHTTKENCNE